MVQSLKSRVSIAVQSLKSTLVIAVALRLTLASEVQPLKQPSPSVVSAVSERSMLSSALQP